MGPGASYAILAFITGLLCLFGWLYATAGNPRSTAMLKKSLWLFVFPIFLAQPLLFSALTAVAFEEGLKAFASTRVREPKDKFWLVVLFGIWEMTLVKPFLGLILILMPPDNWDRIALIGFVLSAAVPVLVHAVTAAVYAFWFQGRLWVAFIASWAFHAAYNLSTQYLDGYNWAYLALAGFLALLLALLVAPQVRNAGRNLA